MTQSLSLMPDSNSDSEVISENISQPLIIRQLPDISLPSTSSMMKLQQHLIISLRSTTIRWLRIYVSYGKRVRIKWDYQKSS